MFRIVEIATSMPLRWLRSRKFFYGIVGLLVVQAAWIALTARYPQAFDENYHLGLTQLHTQQLLPFFTHQPVGPAVYGALERDPSYLYHFIMSFPYRMLAHITSSITTQIIALRFINIGIFVASLYVYRKLLTELNVSRAMMHVVLLFFVLLPVVPVLAGQINYDNLMVYLTGLLFLYAVRLHRALQTPQSDMQPIPLLLILQILLVGALGSIVKFPFAPIFLGILILLGWLIGRHWRVVHRISGVQTKLFVLPSRLKLLLVGGLTIVALLLCVERYGINLVQYHNPVPKCDKVLSIDACMAYSPWARDHMFAATYPAPTLQGITVYPFVWVHRIVYETMFSITSYLYAPWNTVTYIPFPPLTIANYTAWAIVCLGVAALARFWRSIWDNTGLRMLLLVTAFYTSVLFVQNFAMYLHTGEAVAIHGRYLVPVFPVLLVACAVGISAAMEHYGLRRYKTLLLIATLLLFLQGAGIVGWIVRSDPSWYWQQSQAPARANWLAKDVLYKVVHH